MPKVVDISIRNDHTKEYISELNKMIPVVLKTVGAQAVDYAQRETPVDTGTLRNSIAWATSTGTGGKKQSGEGEPSKPEGKPEENTVYIGSNVDYAVYVEYGNHSHKVGKAHFLRDSVANHQDHFKEIIEAGLKK